MGARPGFPEGVGDKARGSSSLFSMGYWTDHQLVSLTKNSSSFGFVFNFCFSTVTELASLLFLLLCCGKPGANTCGTRMQEHPSFPAEGCPLHSPDLGTSQCRLKIPLSLSLAQHPPPCPCYCSSIFATLFTPGLRGGPTVQLQLQSFCYL